MTRTGALKMFLAVGLAGSLCGCGKEQQAAATKTAPVRPVPPTAAAPVQPVAATAPFIPEADDASTYLFDTGPRPATDTIEASFAARKAWKQIPEDTVAHSFAGDALAQNNRIAIRARIGSRGVELFALGGAAPVARTSLGPGGDRKITAAKIAENTTAGIQLDVEFGGDKGPLMLGFRIIPGDALVELLPGAKVATARAEVSTRHVIVPSYFDNDMVFTPDTLSRDRLLLPAEQMLVLPVADGKSLLMCLWESDKQDAAVVFRGQGAERTSEAIEVQALPDRKIWIAVLERAGNWTSSEVAGNGEWQPPFPARWRVDVVKSFGTAESFDFSKERMGQAAKKPYVVYPLERSRTTPIAEFCMRDLMKRALGVGPCEYIIQSMGLVNSATPDTVATWAEKQYAKGKGKETQAELQEMLKQMAEHMRDSQTRIDAFGALAGELGQGWSSATATAPELAKKMPGVDSTLSLVSRLAAPEAGRKRLSAVADLSKRLSEAVVQPGDAAGVAKVCDEIRSLGAGQDKAITQCRIAVRWLRQQFRMAAEDVPQAAQALNALTQNVESKTGVK